MNVRAASLALAAILILAACGSNQSSGSPGATGAAGTGPTASGSTGSAGAASTAASPGASASGGAGESASDGGAAGSGTTGGTGGAIGGAGSSGSVPPASASTGPEAAPGPPGGGVPGGLPDLVARLEPSVVAILREDGGQGSGVVWRADGLVLTNNHVVEGTTTDTVVFADGSRLPGRVLATDPRTDLALIRVARQGLPAATFRPTLPRVGETAIAIGNPLGFEGSVTAGIVSGLGRSVPGSASVSSALVDLLQTDAPISPGNSGGALVGGDGSVIGINVAYLPPSTGSVSIGFAIPSPTVMDVAAQLLQNGKVRHAFMGVQTATLTPQIAQAYGMSLSEGAVVIGTQRGGPADRAGINPGDVITRMADADVRTAEDLLAALRKAAPGDSVAVTIVPGGDGPSKTVSVRLIDLPASADAPSPTP